MKTTIDEIATCLDLPSSTIDRWIRQGRIPIRKSGAGCVFQKSVLELWAKKHNLPFSLTGKDDNEEVDNEQKEPDNLLTALTRGGVYYNISGADTSAILREAVDNISFFSVRQRDDLYRCLLEREKLTSTGIGKGVAIPHPRMPLEDTIEEPVIITCFLASPVDYGAVDDKPVFVLFILLSPTVKVHLHLLSRLAYCVRDNEFVEFLKGVPAESELFSTIGNFEKQLEK